MILVVAHDPNSRQSIVSLVTARGYQAAGIDCNDEMRKRLRFQQPSAVVLDCGLPDSFDVLTEIRAERRATAVPVIMFSTDDADVRERALLTGADAYVPKGSLDWAELIAEISRFAGPPPDVAAQA